MIDDPFGDEHDDDDPFDGAAINEVDFAFGEKNPLAVDDDDDPFGDSAPGIAPVAQDPFAAFGPADGAAAGAFGMHLSIPNASDVMT